MAEPVVLQIQAEGFKGSVLSLSEMPADAVIDTLVDSGPTSLFKAYELFKLAVVVPADRAQLEIVSYGQITGIVQDWMTKSAEAAMDKRMAELEAEEMAAFLNELPPPTEDPHPDLDPPDLTDS